MKVDISDALKSLGQFKEQALKRVAVNMEAAGFNMENNAKTLVPVDLGGLRNSIYKKNTKTTAEIGATESYAPFIEFGTGGLVDVPNELQSLASQFKGRGLRLSNMRPQPFLWPSLIKEKPELEKRLNKEIDKLAKNT